MISESEGFFTAEVPIKKNSQQRLGVLKYCLFDLSGLQMVQGHLAEMALDIDASALLIYRAAWAKDTGAERITKEAAMAKLYATDQAQMVIDKAVQIHGGDGVRKGHIVERLYREIRALRIYEGASDVQKIIIARNALQSGA